MHSVRIELAKLILVRTRKTYQATGDADMFLSISVWLPDNFSLWLPVNFCLASSLRVFSNRCVLNNPSQYMFDMLGRSPGWIGLHNVV